MKNTVAGFKKITTAVQRIVNDRPNRRLLIIQNRGGLSVYLGFGTSDAAVSTGLEIKPDGVLILDGDSVPECEVRAIGSSATACLVSFVEGW